MKILDEVAGYVRVRKEIARKAFENGITVYSIPNRLRFSFDSAYKPFPLSNQFCGDEYPSVYFERCVNQITYYNCNKDTGYYLHYWLKKKDLDMLFMRGIKDEIQKYRNQ